jgi:flagellar hook-associated protein 3 FlgL
MSMRVTERALLRTQQQAVSRAGRDAARAAEVAVSGKRFASASDDPAAAAAALASRSDLQAIRSSQAKAHSAVRMLDAQDAALGAVTDVLSRVRELAVQMSSATANAGDRASAAVEVASLRDALLAIANERVGDRRLFGGRATGADPFDASFAYAGDSSAVAVELAPGSDAQVTLAGDALFRGASGGPDLVAVLDDLEAALTASDATGIRATADATADGIDWIVTQRSASGAQRALADRVLERLDGLELARTQDIAAAEEADPVTAYSELASTRSAYEGALSALAASRPPDVWDRLFG